MSGKTYKKLSADQWFSVRKEYESGQTILALAKNYGVPDRTIRHRAKSEGWTIRKNRIVGESGVGRSKQTFEVSSAPAPSVGESETRYFANTPAESQNDAENQLSLLTANLVELAELPPAEFQAKAAQVMQAMFAAGLQNMPIPQSFKELSSVFSMWRAMTGLDAKDKSAPATLIQPLKAVRRRAPVIVEASEPEPDDLEGFVV